jgi:hypothetical protein
MNITSTAGNQPAAGTLFAATLHIHGVSLAPIEYRTRRVMTLAMIDQVHQRPEGTARRNFNEHLTRLIEGEDFYKVCADEIRSHKIFEISSRAHEDITLLTETGYSMLVKSFTDDLAWDVQRQLVKSYFAKPAQVVDPMASLSPEHRALVALLIESSAIKAEQAAQAEALAAQAEAIKRIESNQTAAVASVQSFTAMGYSIFKHTPMSAIELTRLGKRASAISKKRGITVDQVSDSRFGRVGSYHVTVLDEALKDLSK